MPGDKPKEKRSIHEDSGITTTYNITEIEKALHPRAREAVQEELEDLVNKFAEKHVAKGSVNDSEKAADAFLEMLAKYHFGPAFDAVKEDKKQMAKILEEKYGVTKEALRTQFSRKGAYRTKTALFEQHVNPLVDAVHREKQQAAQQSINTYLQYDETRKEIGAHIKRRTGKDVKNVYDLTVGDVAGVIGTYMAAPGAEEAIGKKDAKVQVSDEMLGRPGVHHVFKEGDKLHDRYRFVAEKVDSMHKFGGKKEKPQYDSKVA